MREIRVTAGDHLHLDETAAAANPAIRILAAAFAERQAAVGGLAVMLDSLLVVARQRGFTGSMEEAAEIMVASGWRAVSGADGRFVVWREE